MPSENVEESCKDNYWLTLVSLLKAGIPWDLLQTLTDTEVAHVVGTLHALKDYEIELQEREARQQQAQMRT